MADRLRGRGVRQGRAGLGIRFVSLLPQLTPRPTWARCSPLPTPPVRVARRAAQGPAVTPEGIGQAVTELVSGPGPDQDAYVLTGAGLRPL